MRRFVAARFAIFCCELSFAKTSTNENGYRVKRSKDNVTTALRACNNQHEPNKSVVEEKRVMS